MVIRLICLLLICGMALLAIPQFAAAENLVLKSSRDSHLCSTIYKVLKLPQNKNYIRKNFFHKEPAQLFYIPPNNKDFSPLVWEDASMDEVKAAVPGGYKAVTEFLKTTFTAQKTQVTLYPGAKPDTLYMLHTGQNGTIIQMREDENIINKTFNKGGLGEAKPFIFKGRIYFSTSDPIAIDVSKFIMLENIHQAGTISVCEIEIKQNRGK